MAKLFDESREYYLLKEKFWDWGSGEILDKEGKIVGYMHRQIFSLRAKIEFKEVDNATISAAINSSFAGPSDSTTSSSPPTRRISGST